MRQSSFFLSFGLPIDSSEDFASTRPEVCGLAGGSGISNYPGIYEENIFLQFLQSPGRNQVGYTKYSGTLYHMRQFKKLTISQENCLAARLDGYALMKAPAENLVVRLRTVL